MGTDIQFNYIHHQKKFLIDTKQSKDAKVEFSCFNFNHKNLQLKRFNMKSWNFSNKMYLKSIRLFSRRAHLKTFLCFLKSN